MQPVEESPSSIHKATCAMPPLVHSIRQRLTLFATSLLGITLMCPTRVQIVNIALKSEHRTPVRSVNPHSSVKFDPNASVELNRFQKKITFRAFQERIQAMNLNPPKPVRASCWTIRK